MQDSKNNILRYRFSLPYIYDVILKQKVVEPSIKRRAELNTFWALVQLKSIAKKNEVDDFIKEENIFSNYLIEKLNSDRWVKTIFAMPTWLVYVIYKSLRKIGVSG